MNDFIEPVDGKYPKKRARKARNLGKLHGLLIRGLPDWVDDGEMLRVYDLARYIGCSYQAVYKWLEREKLSGKRIKALVLLSEQSLMRPDGFEPLTYEDLAEFL